MSDQAQNAITKLDESFGTYSNNSTINEDATVTSRSEDDKTHPLDNTLTLDLDSPSTNDAPDQYSTFEKTPTKEQDKVSNEIAAADAGESLAKEAEAFHEPVDSLAEQIGEPVQGTYPDILSSLQDKAEELAEQVKENPVAAAKEVGKGILMAAGAIAILKGLFGRRR